MIVNCMQKYAADVTNDGNINIADVVKIADHTIQQNVLNIKLLRNIS